jgi:hypothetical protein
VVGRGGRKFWGKEEVEKKNPCGQGGRDFCSSAKRLQRAHPELVHWWLLVHSSQIRVLTFAPRLFLSTSLRSLTS